MAELNEKEKKITFKIVYYGPALSGKTTNLVQLHDMLNPAKCGELMSFDNQEKNVGRVGLDFDNLPLLIQFNKRDLKRISSAKRK